MNAPALLGESCNVNLFSDHHGDLSALSARMKRLESLIILESQRREKPGRKKRATKRPDEGADRAAVKAAIDAAGTKANRVLAELKRRKIEIRRTDALRLRREILGLSKRGTKTKASQKG